MAVPIPSPYSTRPPRASGKEVDRDCTRVPAVNRRDAKDQSHSGYLEGNKDVEMVTLVLVIVRVIVMVVVIEI